MAGYSISLADLRDRCKLLDDIQVRERALLGFRDGECRVRALGKVTPGLVKAFLASYSKAKQAGLLGERSDTDKNT